MDSLRDYVIIVFALLYSSAACAQPQALDVPHMSVAEQALSAKLSQEINTGLQCTANLINAQREIEQLKKQLADAKPKEDEKK